MALALSVAILLAPIGGNGPGTRGPGNQPDSLSAAADVVAVAAGGVRWAQAEQERMAFEGWLAEQVDAAVRYVEAVQVAETQARAAVAQRPVQRPSAPSVGSAGGCTGFAIPSYIIQRESGGNPTAMNPSGAYGCAQIMPYVWSANCSDLDRGVDGQRECVNRISNGGTNLSPWATTR